MFLKLGKKPHLHDPRSLLYKNYRLAPLPAVPAQFGHDNLIPADNWGMLGNGPDDTVTPGFQGAGDCVFAGGCHETMLWTTEGGLAAQFSGANAISDYSAVTGYDPNDPSTDQGTQVSDALAYRRQTGLLDQQGNRHQIGAYLALDRTNLDHLYEALYLFGAVGIGIQFPQSAMDQFSANLPWSVVADSPISGGHYVPLLGKRDQLVCVSWGRTQLMDVEFYQHYCDEAWAIISPEMLKSGQSPENFNLSQLQADLAALQSS